MSIAKFSMQRPVAIMLLWLSVVVTGLVCWFQLPISALPKYETPIIEVKAKLPGASPENISTSVATPLEKEFSAIPGLLSTTSENIQGETKIRLEFSASRDINDAAADVQAAMFRISRSLPADMPTPPSYSKVNPGDAPVINVGMSSPTMPMAELNAYINSLVVPALSAIDGVAQVLVTGRKRHAVRVEVDPDRLAALDLTLIEVSAALKTANSNVPLGQFDNRRQMLMLQMSNPLMRAKDFEKVVIANRQGQVIRLADIGRVRDGMEDAQNTSEINGVNSVLLQIKRQPAANTVETVDAVKALLPRLQGQLPGSVRIEVMGDRSVSIRHAIHDVNLTLLLTIALVVMVILLFLRHWSATFIPAISLPLSLLGTFGLMYAMGLSLNSISLMGLTIAVGLVVDDAIVVLENIMRYIEEGMKPYDAAVRGASEVSFTVMSISVSLVAVFIPIFFMPGTAGLIFHEFAIVVSLSILVSAAVALTLIPVLVPMTMRHVPAATEVPAWLRWFEAGFAWLARRYELGLGWALAHRKTVLAVGFGTVVLTGVMYALAPKGFFPQEDIGQIEAKVKTAQDMSYEGRLAVVRELQAVLQKDPAIETLWFKVDHDTTRFTMDLKPPGQRPPMKEVVARLRKATGFLPGIKVNFSPVQSLKIGSSGSTSAYQYILQSIGSDALDLWAGRMHAELKKSDVFVGLENDFEKEGLQVTVAIDWDRAAALGVDMAAVRNTLYGAYGTRQVSTIYATDGSYQVIMEMAPEHRRDESDLSRIYVRGAGNSMVPLSAFATATRGKGTMTVLHQSQLPAITFSFDLANGKSLSDATAAIDAARQKIGMPSSVFGSFGGQAALFAEAQRTQLWLIAIAVAVIYVVLGMLYESWIHPVTILLGIPSAALGALLALRLAGLELTFIAMIGILLLIGVVKKNAIMMIDFALDAQRNSGASPAEAIRQACLLRFRPIMMTTLCAIVGAVPLALGIGAGAELRQPLGIAIVGGLVFSQMITIFITPVLYLWFGQLGQRRRGTGTSRVAATEVADGIH
ncbi:efflux RND transporter permease subunit [Cupriavidus basilensis]|uniref:Efflux RND transporter permease subunit n=1 Tax=Cupriavidus basilensis TaxID=68895 RepID=A0ABT6B4D1_9BURK|nr:efflux RND transporter permease subunit [Cupriavidus basilensis]MDF3839747.1 efflux RND transporter permease subunit [Cupriavidus basilensis]